MSKQMEVELISTKIMMQIPENAIEVNVSCKVYLDGEIKEVWQTLSLAEIRERMQDAEENYIDPDAKYRLTDKGIEHAQSLMKGVVQDT